MIDKADHKAEQQRLAELDRQASARGRAPKGKTANLRSYQQDLDDKAGKDARNAAAVKRWDETAQTGDNVYAALEHAKREVAELRSLLADHEEANLDRKRLVRALDVALNGEAGAAKQASLCDIVAQVEREKSIPPDPYAGTWGYSHCEEEFYGQFDTAEEATAEATSCMESGQTYYLAQCAHPMDQLGRSARTIGDDLLDTINEAAHDNVGGDDAALDLTEEESTKLGQLVLDFLRRHASVQRWAAINITKHVYTGEQNAE